MHEFVSSPWGGRVHSGQDALAALPEELRRAGIRRPMILCGHSVAHKTALISHIKHRSGGLAFSVFDGIQKEAPLECINAAVVAAQAQHADGLIAVGAGSVIKATRVVAILLAEDRPLEQLITRYPEHGPAVSARLDAPKLPIINVLTAPTSAQCRAGSAISSLAHSHRLEFYDPKTRPRAIFWDFDALLTAPAGLMRTASASVYWRALMNMGLIEQANPLVEGQRLQAFRLVNRAMCRLGDQTPPAARLDLCAAALLQNRDEDDGGSPMQAHWIARLVYALSASVFTLHPQVSQGDAVAALTGTAIRHGQPYARAAIAGIGHALNLATDSPNQVAAAAQAAFQKFGLATRLRDLGIARQDLPALHQFSLKCFNADRHREFEKHPELIQTILIDAW